MTGPVLFCYDGSDGSRAALRVAGDLVARPVDAVVLTVWERAAVRMALAGAFTGISPASENELDQSELKFARAAAEQGAQLAADHGYHASPLTSEATEGAAKTILEVADTLDARLIVCGQRGRGPLRTALLGSVSHVLAAHTRRPVLIAPERAP